MSAGRMRVWLAGLVAGLIGMAGGAGVAIAAPPTTRPLEGLREHQPAVHALINARVVTGPGHVLERATVVWRDGVITAVGTQVAVPADARVWDLTGKTVYPGFINAYAEQTIPDGAGSGTPYWNPQVSPQLRLADYYKPDGGNAEKLRGQGITVQLVAPADGIIKGESLLASTGDEGNERSILRPAVAQHLRLTVSRTARRAGFPGSPMGAVALARQAFLDAQWYEAAWNAHRTQPTTPAPERNDALAALAAIHDPQKLVIVDASDEQFALRAEQFAREFNLRIAIRGSGREYRQVEALAALQRVFVLPLEFPRPPHVASPETAANVAIEDLLHWDYAPENPARLQQAGVKFAFTVQGLRELKDFLPAIRKAVRRGLPPHEALAALTTIPAELFGVRDRLGTIEPGQWANLVVSDGDLFQSNDAQIWETWVLGRRYEIKRQPVVDVSGTWTLQLATPAPNQATTLTLALKRPKEELVGEFLVPKAAAPPAAPAAAPPARETAPPGATPAAAAPSAPKPPGEKADATAPDKPSDSAAKPDETPAKPSETPAKKKKKKKGAAAMASDPPPAAPSAPAAAPAAAAPIVEQEKVPLQQLAQRDQRLTALFEADKWNAPGKAQWSALALRQDDGQLQLRGEIVWSNGVTSRWTATRQPASTPAAGAGGVAATNPADPPADKPTEKPIDKPADKLAEKPDEKPAGKSAEKPAEKPGATEPAVFPLVYPLSAFGREQIPPRPSVVLFQGATVWTCGPAGVLEQASVLVRDGRIEAVGRDVVAPPGALVVDCRGRHLTPGIIDCHSHMATDGGINEATQSVTAEVRVGDFIDATDVNIYRQLAGGVTSSHILHGSANTIGGQCQLIKLRWGLLPEELKFREAPPTIKFALGENVKQSNWDRNSGRYPQSRMGVDEVVRDSFQAARDYLAEHARWQAMRQGLPPRRDLELEALAEILEQKRWIHCHSYRQDEILALLRTLEGFGVRVQTLQHILEGYKVADAMRKHGAAGSSFADWWAYKIEVWDAIPFNGALMHQAGVVVSFNSDDRELARHLNHEAAKAVKYGGVPPAEALKFVTLHPAQQLRVDSWVGSLEPGKQADLVVWSGAPLSTMSRCEQTWVDGRRYFDREEDRQFRQRAATIRTRLVQKILSSGEPLREAGESYVLERDLWPRHDEYCGASR